LEGSNVRSGALGVAHGHFVNSHAVPFAEQNFPSLGEAELKAGAQRLSAVQGASSCGYGFRPYLYSDAEIHRLLSAGLEMPCRFERGELRPWVYYCLFGLLSVSGLRLGEARNLELQDVDLKTAVLTIRGAKFGKTRLVPLHRSTCNVLAEYISRRKRHWGQRPVSSHLFVSSSGHRLDGADIHRTFYALSRQISLRGPSNSHGPRLHDMRQHAESRIMPNLFQIRRLEGLGRFSRSA